MRYVGVLCFSLSCWAQVSMDRSGFVSLSELAPDVVLEMRYLTPYNFMGELVTGYEAPVCWLTEEAAQALARVQADLRQQGFGLKVYDCYRPQRAVDHFVRWAQDLSDQRMKAVFYPGVAKEHLFRDGYIAARSGHSRGSTIDLTIVPWPVPQQPFPTDFRRLPDCRSNNGVLPSDNSVVMGTAYDCFDPQSHTAADGISDEAKRNRQLLKTLMERHGFTNYPAEWWHYTLANEPFPETYFDFPVTEPE